jgi:hypothetical protein
MNKYKAKPEAKTAKKKSNPGKVARSFRDVLNGNVLTRDYVVDNLPYFFFLTFLMLLYIAFGYNTEKNVRRIDKLESSLVELNSEYISLKTELNMVSRQTQIADSVAPLGLYEMKDESPIVVTVSKEQKEKMY